MRPSPPNKPEQPRKAGLLGQVVRWFGFGAAQRAGAGGDTASGTVRVPRTHVVVMDGTMSRLDNGYKTNAAQTAELLREVGGAVRVLYVPGLQLQNARGVLDVLSGRGINRQIRHAYGYLAAQYRPGDRIFLMGYSRGAYAVRSLAGVIDLIGLLRPEHATQRNVRTAYRHYQCEQNSPEAAAFRRSHCHEQVPIEMIGVWDTVKSLGINAPVLWRLSTARYAFHNDQLSASVKHGFHALALNETRVAFKPVLWRCETGHEGRVEQMWFRGVHGDVGGHLGGFMAARPLANIPLVWLLSRAQEVGLPLPKGWNLRFVQDATAPSMGTWRGWGRVLITRRKRVVGVDSSEHIHPTAQVPTDPQAAPAPQQDMTGAAG